MASKFTPGQFEYTSIEDVDMKPQAQPRIVHDVCPLPAQQEKGGAKAECAPHHHGSGKFGCLIRNVTPPVSPSK